MSEFGV